MSENFLKLLQSWNTDILISLKHNMSKFWGQEEDQTLLFQHERKLSYLNSNMVQVFISTAETVTSVNANANIKKCRNEYADYLLKTLKENCIMSKKAVFQCYKMLSRNVHK